MLTKEEFRKVLENIDLKELNYFNVKWGRYVWLEFWIDDEEIEIEDLDLKSLDMEFEWDWKWIKNKITLWWIPLCCVQITIYTQYIVLSSAFLTQIL